MDARMGPDIKKKSGDLKNSKPKNSGYEKTNPYTQNIRKSKTFHIPKNNSVHLKYSGHSKNAGHYSRVCQVCMYVYIMQVIYPVKSQHG